MACLRDSWRTSLPASRPHRNPSRVLRPESVSHPDCSVAPICLRAARRIRGLNDADRLGRDPAMRWIVGGRAVTQNAASASQMGRFETEVLVQKANLSALADLPGRWIDRVHARRPVKGIVLDMDSSVSSTFGAQEGTTYNGHFSCTCYHPLFVFNQFGDLERCALRPGNVHSAEGWRDVLEPVSPDTGPR